MNDPTTRSVLQQVLDRGELRLAVEFKDPVETGFPPEMFLDRETGTPTGVAPELCRLMARDLGVDLACIDLPWPEHMEALLAGTVDLIVGTNTPRRALEVDFVPCRLMENRVTALVPSGAGLTLTDIQRRHPTLVCWHGSSIVDVARERFPEAEVIESNDPPAAIRSGKASVFVTDAVTYRLLEILEGFDLVCDDDGSPAILSREYVHFAMAPRDLRFMMWMINWYDFHSAQGTISAWCQDYWEAAMADAPMAGKA